MPTQRLHRLPLRQETDGALEALVQGRLELGVVAFHTFAAGAARGWLSSQPLSSSGEGCWICPSVTRGCGEGGREGNVWPPTRGARLWSRCLWMPGGSDLRQCAQDRLLCHLLYLQTAQQSEKPRMGGYPEAYLAFVVNVGGGRSSQMNNSRSSFTCVASPSPR